MFFPAAQNLLMQSWDGTTFVNRFIVSGSGSVQIPANGWLDLPVYTVATLPAAATATAGAKAFVSDANATTFHSVVVGGGGNFVPVFSDGTNWRIG